MPIAMEGPPFMPGGFLGAPTRHWCHSHRSTSSLFTAHCSITCALCALYSHTQYLASITFYNTYLHPLTRFPEPKLWAGSRLPFVLAMRSGSLVHRIQTFHDTYGGVIRLAPNEVSFIDPQACRDIYAYRSGHRPFPKNQVWCQPRPSIAARPLLFSMRTTKTTLASGRPGLRL